MLEVLRRIGLSEGEVRVYAALLDLGGAPLNAIHERVGIERRNIYDILNKLIERGLVTYITENKRRLFRVTHPSKIVGYVDEKLSVLERTKGEIEEKLPALLEKFSTTRSPIDAQLFRGPEGIKAVWEDMLNERTIYWIGSGRYIPKALPHFFASWNRRRVERRIWMRNIMRAEMRKEVRAPYSLEKLRYLPGEFSGNPTVIGVYGDKVVNFLLGRDLFAFVIESGDLAENYRRYHRYLWEKVAKP